MENKENKKPLVIKIISPSGVHYDSMEKSGVFIKSVVAKGVVSSKGSFPELQGEAAFDAFDFEILPDHSPFIGKVSPESEIRLTGDKIPESNYRTSNGGIVTVSYTDTHTIALFTLQDIKNPDEKL